MSRKALVKRAKRFIVPNLILPIRPFLAINSGFAVFTILGAAAVALKIPLGKVAWEMWAGFLVAFVLALPRFSKLKVRWGLILSLVVLIGATLTPLRNALFLRAFVSNFPDAWSYSAFGQYLTDYSRGQEGGLPPIDQYAVHLSSTRFGTPALLAVFAILFRTDTCLSTIPFAALALVNIGMGFMALARLFGCNRLCSLGAGCFAVMCGWIPNALRVGNFDNLLFLALLPAIIFRFRLMGSVRGQNLLMSSLGLAISLAAAAYAYPEGLVISGAVFCLFFLFALVRSRAKVRLLIGSFFALLLGLILVSPYLDTLYRFVLAQIGANTGARPGEGVFSGLFRSPFLPAWLGLGEEFYPGFFSPLDLVLPFILLLLLVFGLVRVSRSFPEIYGAIFGFAGMAIWQGAVARYDYGLYKIILISSVAWLPLMFAGLDLFLHSVVKSSAHLAKGAAVAGLCLAGYLEQAEDLLHIDLLKPVPIKPFSQLRRLDKITGNLTISLDCQTDFDQEWAVFFLRDRKLSIAVQKGYMAQPHLVPLMRRAKNAGLEPQLIISDYLQPNWYWKNKRFFLLPATNFLRVDAVEPRENLELEQGRSVLWLGRDTTRITVFSAINQKSVFAFRDLRSNLESINPQPENLIIETEDSVRKVVLAKGLVVPLILHPGANELQLRCETSSDPGKVDGRKMIGLRDYSVAPSPE